MARKRGNNEGTITKRKDGRWEARLTTGRDPVTGKPKRVTLYGKTRQEAADKLAKAKAELLNGTYIEPSGLTVGKWLDTWLEQYARPHVRRSTYDCYELMIRQHLKPALGNIPLKDLLPAHLQSLYNAKLANGRVDGQGGLSGRTVRLIHTTIHAALKQALKENLVARNVADSTKPPRQEKREMRVLSVEEQERFEAALAEDRLGVAFLLDLGTGLRRGELLALRWKDVNLKEGMLTVSRGLVEVKTGNKEGKRNELIFQEPKTASGRRTIPIPEAIIPELKAHRARQAQEKLIAGGAYEDNGLVFATALGKPIHPRNFTRSFYRLVEQAGIGRANLHCIRHSYATRLLEGRVHPKVAQELLGHSQISQTLNTYSHVSMDLKRQAVEGLNDILSPQKNKPAAKAEG